MPLFLLLAACRSGDDTPADDRPGDGAGGPDCTPIAPVVINEASPSNMGILRDVDGDAEDWIELYNAGTQPVDLAGWGLSDDPDDGPEWTFPDVSLAPGAFLVVYASGEDTSQVVGSWDTRVDQGDVWRYLPVTGFVDSQWYAPEFDDSGWATGPSGFGYGDGDDATFVDTLTTYVRTTVALSADEASDLEGVWLHVDYDDAFVAYVNGAEVARDGIGLPGTDPAWESAADQMHDALMPQGLPPKAWAVPPSMFHEGENTLAVEVHNRSATSVDLSLVPFLSLGFGTPREGRTSSAFALPPVQLHTSFSLDSEGESVALFDPAGCQASTLSPVALRGDESIGRQPDGAASIGYFLAPTPGAANTTEMRPGFAPTPVFDPAPGWYAGGTDVTLSAGDAEVHWTTGGAEPGESDPVAAGPVATGGGSDAVVLRARAYDDALWPSRIATGTYLVHPPGGLPIVSVVTDPANLWDEETGIYAEGPNSAGPPSYEGANFMQDWERPVHLSMWETDGSLAFAVDGSIAIHGGYSRRHAQKSLLVEVGGGWGDASEIEHAIFPGLGIDSFDRVLLRAAGNDWLGCFEMSCSYGAHLRDPLMHEIASGQGLDVLASRPAEVYLNGEYWGIYHVNERPDDSWIDDHYGEEDIDLLEGEAQPVDGDALHWHEMMDWLRTHDLSSAEGQAYVEAAIDVDELASYLAFEVYYDNTDWPGNNVKYWRARDEGRWRWILYDTDFGLGLYRADPSHDSLAAALDPAGEDWPNPPWSTELFRLLVTSPQFTERFVNRYADHMNTVLEPEAAIAVLHGISDEMAADMPRHLERWGTWSDGTTDRALYDGVWEDELAWLETWLRARPDHARDHVVAAFGLPGTWTLSLDADPPGSGSFALTAVTVDAPFEGTYFRGIPVTVTALPTPGYTFAGWSDPSLPDDATVTVDPSGALSLTARFE